MERDLEKRELEKIEGLVSLEGKEALEIGCGDGAVSAFLVGKLKKLIAIDPDEEALEKARQSVKGVDFRKGSGEALEFEDSSFDLVLFTLSLHHQNSKRGLKEAFRVLRKNGRVIVVEPRADSHVQQIFMVFENEEEMLNEALKAIEESDFEIERKEAFFSDLIFENREELYEYFFGYYNAEKTEEKILEINEFVGEKIETRPIALKDKISIFSLKKR